MTAEHQKLPFSTTEFGRVAWAEEQNTPGMGPAHLLPDFWGLSWTAPMAQITVLLEPHCKLTLISKQALGKIVYSEC